MSKETGDADAHAPVAGRGRGRRLVLGVAAGAALMTAGGLLATVLVKSPARLAAEAAPPEQGPLLAPVERRVLAETVVVRGTVVADQSVAVRPQAAGAAAVVTRLPLAAGGRVRAGQLLAEVSGRPVFALRGPLPAYRDLRPGSTGADVAQLQRALRELGRDTAPDRSGSFGPGTGAALTALYRALGYRPSPAVADGAEVLATAREAVREARWSLEDAETARTETGRVEAAGPAGPEPGRAEAAGTGAGGAGAGGTEAGRTAAAGGGQGDRAGSLPGIGTGTGGRAGDGGRAGRAAERAVLRAREVLAEARRRLAAAEAADGPLLPVDEVVFLRALPARVSGVGGRVGEPVTGPLLTLAAGELLVETLLPADRRRLLRPGMPVRISSEALGTEVSGRVLLVSPERTTAAAPAAGADGGSDGGGGSEAAGVPAASGHRMLVRPDRPLPAGFTGQDVRLTVEAAATAGKALVVPVTAVSAGADGRTSVTVWTAPGPGRRVEVRTGTGGDGYVEVVPVRPGSLAEGDRVVTGTAGPDGPEGTPGAGAGTTDGSADGTESGTGNGTGIGVGAEDGTGDPS